MTITTMKYRCAKFPMLFPLSLSLACTGSLIPTVDSEPTQDPALVGMVQTPAGGLAPGGSDAELPMGQSGGPTVTELPGDQRTLGCDSPIPGPRIIRRLTADEFTRTLETLFQSSEVPKVDVLAGTLTDGYETRADGLLVRDLGAQTLMDAVGGVATWALQSQRHRITNCQDHGPGCWRSSIEEFGKRAFREPLAPEQVERYLPLFERAPDLDAGLHSMVQTMLQSPYFLYRRELGVPTGGESVDLSPYELASSLAYLLTGSAPDDALLDAAAQGRLASPEQLDEEVQRLLYSDEARQRFSGFVASWLDLDKVLSQAKTPAEFELTAELRSAMWEESQAFVENAYDEGNFVDLFGAQHTFLGPELSGFYGLGGNAGGMQRIALDGTNRVGGLLGQSSFLLGHSSTDSSSPTARGVAVRERLLCLAIVAPPPSVNTNLPDVSNAVTTRERFDQHRADPTCSACHAVFDPIGFGFEQYDGFGRYRTMEGGVPVDASGVLVGLSSGDVPFVGLNELAGLVSNSDQVRLCLAKNLAEYSYGVPEWEADACTTRELSRRAIEEGDSLKGYFKALTGMPHFRTRRVEP